MNCIIVDDEPLARKEMESLIEESSNITIFGKFSNGSKALEFLKENEVDLIFLDIEMPFFSGLDLAELLPMKTLVIFTTAYPQYAHKSYELDAIDYLVKPIDKLRLKKAINKAVLYKTLLDNNKFASIIEEPSNEFFWIKSERRNHKLNYKEILFIEGLKDYVVIHTVTQKLITAMNLKTIHQKLIPSFFLRVSKSYIINVNHIDSFNTHNVYIGEFEIPLGETYRKDFLDLY
ncbi:two-component system response regulator [Myroides odoratimimus]|uniref:LytR/AlgR family response regulator transcription factor n=1 Tax=Myroides odoratimimus TaxID=76832 RepID=UPI00072AC705|nr:LytTR family DNA-binding domain-containing protein [Myroides odoratimimus]GAQ14674.1 two-component system response regulator [Myroides odoratimimus]STZ49503.1 Sensory transduction protein lytR [Myroides odoratimimus]